jgi:hypothetical protein
VCRSPRTGSRDLTATGTTSDIAVSSPRSMTTSVMCTQRSSTEHLFRAANMAVPTAAYLTERAEQGASASVLDQARLRRSTIRCGS